MEYLVMEDLSILHVEDDESVRESLCRLLERRFGRVFSASDGEEGLAMFKANNPDIIITDIQMPVMDGLEMSARIKKVEPDLPIIITTAYNETPFLDRALSLGIQRYICKPIIKSEFLGSLYEVALVLIPGEKKTNSEIEKILEEIAEPVIYGVGDCIVLANDRAYKLFGNEKLKGNCVPSTLISSLPSEIENWQKAVIHLKENISGDIIHSRVELNHVSDDVKNEKIYVRVEWNKKNGKFLIAFVQGDGLNGYKSETSEF